MWWELHWKSDLQPVVNEFYDEFVFNEPTEYMYQLYPFERAMHSTLTQR